MQMTPRLPKSCARCGEPFAAKTKRAVYCRPSCCNAAYKARRFARVAADARAESA